MRFAFVLSLINILHQLSHNEAIFPGNIANQYYLNKQRFMLEILHHVQEPLLHEQWIALGQQIVSDKSQYVHYNDHMRQFYQYLSTGRLLPRDVYYNPQQPEHYRETLGLFHFFYNTREWSTLMQNICWARLHVNPALFLHALMQTMLKREDYQPLIMPKIYELLPAPYHSERVVREASKFNYINWIRQHLMGSGNESHVQLVLPKRLLPTNMTGDLRGSTSKWSEAMSEVQVLSLTATNLAEQKLGHLIEDHGWLAYWYYINMGVTLQQQQPETARIRDWWYWRLGQILARYKLERYGQRMEYKRLSMQEQGKYHWLTWQSQRYQPESEATRQHLTDLLHQLQLDVEQSIATQSYRLSNGTVLDLRKDQNWLLGLDELFPYDLSQLQLPFAGQSQQLLELHTMLREPNFYSYADRLIRAYRSYRTEFQPSYHQSVRPIGMSIQEVLVDPLITFDEPVDVDLSNVLHARNFFYEKHFMWPHSLQARRHRLQQQPFAITFHLESNRTQSVILRTYLTTSGGAINEEPFYQLDSFLTILYKGNNTIRRASRDFLGNIGDHISFTELYHYLSLAEQEQYDFPLNITTPSCGFPRRLILPRGGTAKPLSMRLLILATPYTYKARQGQEMYCDFGDGISSWDELPHGYPFERFVEPLELLGSHTFWQAVELQHKGYNEVEN
ncbi:larval serum protein 1 alpha chain [Drosophila novamexicana]|uniref:larval serum protein 1 alpha chain n=1 Tax=Drosophila novamexicana TaxID=47314 RepID=UPI0011E601A4|nr:larval serum protein 1 alpha chain [Drosophila novamexicana]